MCMYLLSENFVILLKLKKSIVKGLSLPPPLTCPSLSHCFCLSLSLFISSFSFPPLSNNTFCIKCLLVISHIHTSMK